ncbi:unnamed protein product [Pleuronectes platessa]|uniref:Uncharacterized protein n=1 Tax=Pleuronectes platessa TaxID=8262 RepID=A0A9N7UGF9_PLEPL|nr:unnamed protein product [Pleuronectes platessa]
MADVLPALNPLPFQHGPEGAPRAPSSCPPGKPDEQTTSRTHRGREYQPATDCRRGAPFIKASSAVLSLALLSSPAPPPTVAQLIGPLVCVTKPSQWERAASWQESFPSVRRPCRFLHATRVRSLSSRSPPDTVPSSVHLHCRRCCRYVGRRQKKKQRALSYA